MTAIELVEAWWRWIAPLALQVTPLAALAWLADRWLARSRASAWRSLPWIALALRIALPPSLEARFAPSSLVFEPAWATLEPLHGRVAGDWGWLAVAFAAWIAGAAAVAARCAIATHRERRELASAAPVKARALAVELARAARTLGLSRAPRVLVSASAGCAALVGTLRPIVVVPASYLAPERRPRLRHALLHELAHWKRRDPLWRLLATACLALLWFHPFIWIAARRFAVARELGCDRAVVRALGRRAVEYRATLIDLARERWLPSAALSFQSAIVARLLALEHVDGAREPRGTRCVAAIALVCGLALVPMNSIGSRLRSQARAVLAAEQAGVPQSCFQLQAAAIALAAQP